MFPSGTDVPVIVVHGLNGAYQNQFGGADPRSILGRIETIDGIRLVQQFQHAKYSLARTSVELANSIDCAAQQSLRSGGRGKVIVIGSSQGAALTHAAASQRSFDGARAIKDELGFVITVGDAWKIPLFAPWSDKPFPTTFRSRAIGGNIIKVQRVNGRILRTQDTRSDGLISIQNALGSGSRTSTAGAGRAKLSCIEYYSDRFFWRRTGAEAPCRHANLLNYGPVRVDVENALRRYAASLPPLPQQSTTLTVGPLTMAYPESNWRDAQYGASGPGEDSAADDRTNSAPCTNCDETPPPNVSAFVQVFNMKSWCTGASTILECAVGDREIVGAAPEVLVGGKSPDSSARYVEGSSPGTGLMWCFSAEQVCVTYRRATESPQLEPSQALRDLLSSATWGDLL